MSTFQAQMAENKLRAFIVCLKMRRLFKIEICLIHITAAVQNESNAGRIEINMY